MPHRDPWHVNPKPFPHRAFVVTFRVDEGEAVEVLVDVARVEDETGCIDVEVDRALEEDVTPEQLPHFV